MYDDETESVFPWAESRIKFNENKYKTESEYYRFSFLSEFQKQFASSCGSILDERYEGGTAEPQENESNG
jgi:hypothetical protein